MLLLWGDSASFVLKQNRNESKQTNKPVTDISLHTSHCLTYRSKTDSTHYLICVGLTVTCCYQLLRQKKKNQIIGRSETSAHSWKTYDVTLQCAEYKMRCTQWHHLLCFLCQQRQAIATIEFSVVKNHHCEGEWKVSRANWPAENFHRTWL